MFFPTRCRWLAVGLITVFCWRPASAQTVPRPYWAQFTVETCQGVICRTQLAMWPADGPDVNNISWQTMEIDGQASTKSSTQPQLDARNSAIATLLTDHGRKWVRGDSFRSVTAVRDQASVRYEAMVMLPLQELSHQYSHKGTVFSGKWKAQFCPAAFGPPSPLDRVKSRLTEALREVFSVFH
jgi:hypothetical protein